VALSWCYGRSHLG